MGLWPESGNRARKLFNTISNKKKLMVGCKADLFQKTRAKRTHCVPCSVVTNYNIDNVFEQVTEILQFQDSPNFSSKFVKNFEIFFIIVFINKGILHLLLLGQFY